MYFNMNNYFLIAFQFRLVAACFCKLYTLKVTSIFTKLNIYQAYIDDH